MAITGFTLPHVAEAVQVTIDLFFELDIVADESELRSSFTRDYARLLTLGDGRLYPELPAVITTGRLAKVIERLTNEAVELPYDTWKPGADSESLTDEELSGTAMTVTARIALYSKDPRDQFSNLYDGQLPEPLLHFMELPYDQRGAVLETEERTQLDALDEALQCFAEKHPDANMRPADHRDYLVWCLMDLIRGRMRRDMALAYRIMHIPKYGRCGVETEVDAWWAEDHSTDVIQLVAYVGTDVVNGKILMSADEGWSDDIGHEDHSGIGLSAGFNE